MIATATEIAMHILKRSGITDERFVFFCWGVEDVRAATHDWALNDSDLQIVHERLNDAFENGADYPVMESIVEELLEERRETRTVTIPATALEAVMQLAGREMERIADCAERGGGSAEETLKEENEIMRTLRQTLSQW